MTLPLHPMILFPQQSDSSYRLAPKKTRVTWAHLLNKDANNSALSDLKLYMHEVMTSQSILYLQKQDTCPG